MKNAQTKNIFMMSVIPRNNAIMEAIQGFAFSLGSYPSLIVEVFLRRQFGERTFTFSTVLMIFTLLFWPFLEAQQILQTGLFGRAEGLARFYTWPWGIFLLVFLGLSIRHRLEIVKYGTTFNMERFSLSSGLYNQFLDRVLWQRIKGKRCCGVTIGSYQITVFFEAGLVILIGVVILILTVSFWYSLGGLGGLILFCGIVYGLRNFAKAVSARHHILDKIDKKICEEGMYNALVNSPDSPGNHGLILPINLPIEEAARLALFDTLIIPDEDFDPWVPEPEAEFYETGEGNDEAEEEERSPDPWAVEGEAESNSQDPDDDDQPQQ